MVLAETRAGGQGEGERERKVWILNFMAKDFSGLENARFGTG